MKSEPELYKPAEACRMAEVAPYVLRYWETEFPVLAEGKDQGGARLYSAREVKIITRIRELLYDEGFTVAGAKKRLEAEISEGRFDDGLKSAPSVAEQTTTTKSIVEVGESVFLSESGPSPKTASPAVSGPDFPERKKVIRELREIVKLLDKSRRK